MQFGVNLIKIGYKLRKLKIFKAFKTAIKGALILNI